MPAMANGIIIARATVFMEDQFRKLLGLGQGVTFKKRETRRSFRLWNAAVAAFLGDCAAGCRGSVQLFLEIKTLGFEFLQGLRRVGQRSGVEREVTRIDGEWVTDHCFLPCPNKSWLSSRNLAVVV